MGTQKKSPQRKRSFTKPMAIGRGRSVARAGLAGALFTLTQQRLLTLLFGQPERALFMREIIDLARSGRGAVQRELARLLEAGLIVMTQVGNQNHFQANRAAPIFDEIRGIILKTTGLAEPIRAALSQVLEPIKVALIYGSVAKRTDTASSDVDLLIVSERLSLENAYAALAPAEQAISRKINITLLTPEEFQQRHTDNSPFLTKVLSGQHILLVGEVNGILAAR